MKSLSELHREMDRQHDIRRGLVRLFGHFILSAAVPQVVAMVAEELGATILWFALFQMPLIAAGLVFIFWLEFMDLEKHRNGVSKGMLDFASKAAGWSIGVLTWLYWWE